MRRKALQPGVVILVGGLAACGTLDPRACTLEARAGISIDVRDSLTGAVAGRSASIIARDGAYADTADFTAHDGPYGVAIERAGTYTVTVAQQGYRPWSRSGVDVTRDACHVRTVSLTARLQR